MSAKNGNILFGLIGYPLSHSFSKSYFTEKFKKEGLENYSYETFPLETIEEFDSLINANKNLLGLNVTIPYKEKILSKLDELDPVATAVGAVNCIKFEDGRKFGYNTDVYGFQNSIKPFLARGHEKVLILGTGGASKAVAYVFQQLGIPCFFVSRTPEPEHSNYLSYSELNKHVMASCTFIVNTTPVGMYPNVNDRPPIPYEFLTEKHFLYDLIYNPEETSFLKSGKMYGAETLNGLSMLHQQAEKAWEIWMQE